jgi:hypothetical protein
MKVSARSTLKKIKRNDLVWRLGSNFSPSLKYGFGFNERLGDAETEIVKRLNEDGIAISSVDSLPSLEGEFEGLCSAADRLIDEKMESISKLRRSADDDEQIGSKTFNLEMLGSQLLFDPKSTFARFALNRTFVSIANRYFQMCAKLRYYNVWLTAASRSKARESQLWHFDREDNYILKVFLYLDDVDEGSGPFTYAPGTHGKGRHRTIKPEYFMEGGVMRTTDDQMAAAYPRDKWKVGTGKKGTIIFADTRGYHKGGEARTKDRLMFTCMYTSPASESKELLSFPSDLDRGSLTPIQLRALGLK